MILEEGGKVMKEAIHKLTFFGFITAFLFAVLGKFGVRLLETEAGTFGIAAIILAITAFIHYFFGK